jgi:threonyl-tRNA synthetase
VQLDFAVPASDRMNLTYVGSDGKPAHPFVIHRAPLATHERFVAFLLEHFAGAFPSWLAPVQVAVLPISEKFNDYASKVHASLRSELVRAELDLSSTPLGHKVRDAELMKVPYLIILGAREVTEEVVTVRVRGKAAQSRMRLGDFQAGLHREIAARSPVLAVLGEETVY